MEVTKPYGSICEDRSQLILIDHMWQYTIATQSRPEHTVGVFLKILLNKTFIYYCCFPRTRQIDKILHGQ